MAYDLLYKTRIPVNCSMDATLGPTLNKPTATLLGLSVASLLRSLFVKASRNAERKHYQRAFRVGHHPTVELPVNPSNRDLLFGRNGTDG